MHLVETPQRAHGPAFQSSAEAHAAIHGLAITSPLREQGRNGIVSTMDAPAVFPQG